MTTFVEVVVNIPRVSGVFHYHLPEDLSGKTDIGHLVTVPFGSQTVQGVVLQMVDTPAVPETRAVISLLDPEAIVTGAQIELARYLSKVSLTPLAACLSLMLPPGLSQIGDTLYQLTEGGRQLAEGAIAQTADGSPALSDAQRKLLVLLAERGPLRGRQLDRALPRRRWKASAQALQRRGFITTSPILREPSVRPKTERVARLAYPPEQIETQMDNLGRAGSTALDRRQVMLRQLVQAVVPVRVAELYQLSGGNSNDIRYLAEKGLIALEEHQVWRDPLAATEFVATHPPVLTQAQQTVWDQVELALRQSTAGEAVRPFLLYGITGSGKTEIYLRAVDAILQQGRQAIVLVPEIALTPQTVRRFLARFPGKVGLMHSRLSAGERYDTWRRVRAGELDVVVGPRSALFAPLARVGLIVVDECHDDSYYQGGDTPPAYHARELAAAYAFQVGAVCLMGSATPDVVSTYRAAQGKWAPLSLPERILAHKDAVGVWQPAVRGAGSRYRPLEQDAQTIDLPPVTIVDMRAELKRGNTSIFSRALQGALRHVLKQHHQAILFLNRRGTATYVFCRECGQALKCPRCDVPLTYHVDMSKRQDARTPRRPDALICHRCNYHRSMPGKCPHCGGTKIRHYGTGTERVESEIKKLFPGVRTLRWDWETTRKKGAHADILRRFSAHKADVLIGTQMLAKGLDLPLVTLVGVVLADVGLNLPDYRANERVFQVLTQVAGRAGRSPLGGEVILQTFQPEMDVIQAAAQQSYSQFYRRELGHRRELGYPPFSRLVRLEFRDEDPLRVEEAARKASSRLASLSEHAIEVIGPVPCFFERFGGIYRWQIVLRGADPTVLLTPQITEGAYVEVDPPSLL